MMTQQQLVKRLIYFFEGQGWDVKFESGTPFATLPSGYGDGPVVINLSQMADELEKKGQHDD